MWVKGLQIVSSAKCYLHAETNVVVYIEEPLDHLDVNVALNVV